MAGLEPGDRPRAAAGKSAPQLERPPGERYAEAGAGRVGSEATNAVGNALLVPLARSLVAALVGTVLLYALGALLSSSGGLLFVAGLTGAAVGLLLARAAAPGRSEMPALSRRQVTRAAIAISILAVVIAAVGTWLHALVEGGALGLLDYLLETFGVIVPAELVIAALSAAWGAGAGPVER
jgi:hypothetical protein